MKNDGVNMFKRLWMKKVIIFLGLMLLMGVGCNTIDTSNMTQKQKDLYNYYFSSDVCKKIDIIDSIQNVHASFSLLLYDNNFDCSVSDSILYMEKTKRLISDSEYNKLFDTKDSLKRKKMLQNYLEEMYDEIDLNGENEMDIDGTFLKKSLVYKLYKDLLYRIGIEMPEIILYDKFSTFYKDNCTIARLRRISKCAK
jgi:hypothetical protein